MSSITACKFCGSTSARLTREHVYPRHWQAYFSDLKRDRVVRSGADSTVIQAGAANQFENQVRDFCGACNSGWMRELDEAVKPFVIPIALGERTRISADEGDLFRSWATKIALVRSLQDAASGQQAGPERFNEYFQSREPFGRLLVQASRCAPSHLDSNHSFMNTDGSGALSNVVSVAIGELFFQVGIAGPNDEAWQSVVRADLAMVRKFANGRIKLLVPGRPTELGGPLTDTEVAMAREVHALAGRTPASLNIVKVTAGKEMRGSAFGNPFREPAIHSIQWKTHPEPERQQGNPKVRHQP